MIFGRILKSLKSGHWQVAAIELVMIIVGVFIAFQVDQWNEDRKTAAVEILWLEAVRADLEQSLPFLQGRVAFEETVIKGMDEVIRALETGELETKNQKSFERGLQMRFVSPTPFQLIGTIQQLNADGQMNEIQDSVLRRKLIALVGYAAAYDKNISGIEESLRNATYHNAEFYEMGLDLETGRPFMVSFNMQTMRKNPQFKLDIIYVRGLHALAKGANETFVHRIEEVIEALDKFLAGNEEDEFRE